MKKKKWLRLLSLACALTIGLALGACAENEETKNTPTEIEQVYAQYVVYAEAEGQEPLSYENWLAMIKGEDGADGKSAYQIWLDNGNKGTQADFLNWLKGQKGDDGTSANHSWNGTKLTITSASGTSTADLKGEKGDDGKSAFAAAQDGGFEGTEVEFGTKLAELLTLLTSITEADEGKVLKVIDGKLSLVSVDNSEGTE